MSSTRVYVARLAGCAVFDPLGDRVGRVRDVATKDFIRSELRALLEELDKPAKNDKS